ncbi:MAG TPA: response regulator, partial [Candidatus Methylomirabilis sp.]
MTDWRILVADDEPYVVLAIKEVLESLPASVLEAQDGEEALRLAKAELPDIILLDVKMPRLDGFQVARALKQDPTTAGIPLIFFSALGAPSEKIKGLELGADDYVAKPIDAEELKARVRTILRRGRPEKGATFLASGQLEVMNLPSLVRALEGDRRTTRLLLTRGEEQGEIVFEDGHITRAMQGQRQHEAAVYELLSWQE